MVTEDAMRSDGGRSSGVNPITLDLVAGVQDRCGAVRHFVTGVLIGAAVLAVVFGLV